MKTFKNYSLIIMLLFIITLVFSFMLRKNIILTKEQTAIMKIYYALPDNANKLIYYEVNRKPKIIFAHFEYATTKNGYSEVNKYYAYLVANGWKSQGTMFKKGKATIEFVNINESTYTYYIYLEEP